MPIPNFAASAYRHIERLNPSRLNDFMPLYLQQQPVGWVTPQFATELCRQREVFQLRTARSPYGHALWLEEDFATPTALTHWLDQLNSELIDAGLFSHTTGEYYPLGPRRSLPVGLIDRACVARYGIRSYGQHLNGYVIDDSGNMSMWIAKRDNNRFHEPGKLDQLVAGGVPAQISLAQNLLKESQEEASIPAELVRQAKAVGTISYCAATEGGLKPDLIFNYDLQLPQHFTPHNNDGEVERFMLLPIAEVAERVRDTDQFKHNCNLVIIDFLLRHGLLSDEEELYPELVSGLHPALP